MGTSGTQSGSNDTFRDSAIVTVPAAPGPVGVGRSNLQQSGHSVLASPGSHDEFLRGWSQQKVGRAPFATNYHTKANKEVRFLTRSLTSERVLGQGASMGATIMHESSMTPWRATSGQTPPAGASSGRCDRDFGRVGMLNGRYGSRPT